MWSRRGAVPRAETVAFAAALGESPPVHRYPFELDVSPEQYLDYYRGIVKQVQVRSSTGQTVQFPASLLQKFVSTNGIRGRFVLFADANNKVVELRRVG